jgi:hypothetical protein
MWRLAWRLDLLQEVLSPLCRPRRRQPWALVARAGWATGVGRSISKTLLHATMVGSAGIFQAERHGEVAIRAERGDERGRELVGLFHRNLVIARVDIQKREDFTS